MQFSVIEHINLFILSFFDFEKKNETELDEIRGTFYPAGPIFGEGEKFSNF